MNARDAAIFELIMGRQPLAGETLEVVVGSLLNENANQQADDKPAKRPTGKP